MGDTEYAVFEGDTETSKSPNGVALDSCTGKIGNVITSKRGICIKAGGGISYKNDDRRFIIKSGTGYTGTPFEDSTNNTIIKRGDNYIIKDLFYISKLLSSNNNMKI